MEWGVGTVKTLSIELGQHLDQTQVINRVGESVSRPIPATMISSLAQATSAMEHSMILHTAYEDDHEAAADSLIFYGRRQTALNNRRRMPWLDDHLENLPFLTDKGIADHASSATPLSSMI